MKCEKCGYVSFDYLSECKKCGIDLSALRDGMGFPAVKPQPPSFLESILKDRSGGTREPKQEAVSFESTLPPLDLDDEPADAMIPLQTESSEEILLEDTEIKFDESKIMIDKDLPSSGRNAAFSVQQAEPALEQEPLELDIDLLLEEDDPAQSSGTVITSTSASEPARDASGLQNADEDLVIEISEDELQNLLSDLEAVPSDEEMKKR